MEMDAGSCFPFFPSSFPHSNTPLKTHRKGTWHPFFSQRWQAEEASWIFNACATNVFAECTLFSCTALTARIEKNKGLFSPLLEYEPQSLGWVRARNASDGLSRNGSDWEITDREWGLGWPQVSPAYCHTQAFVMLLKSSLLPPPPLLQSKNLLFYCKRNALLCLLFCLYKTRTSGVIRECHKTGVCGCQKRLSTYFKYDS